MIWANLLHLGLNMWNDRESIEWGLEDVSAKPYLRFDSDLWNELLGRMRDAGVNMVVIDLGEAVVYKSHPELAVKDAWSIEKLQSELSKMRAMGLEPIPKLNFSSAHDTWMGEYSHCLSTPVYYSVVNDLISEVCDIFDKPRFLHLGMDEETYEHQQYYEYVVVRQFDGWWRDFLKMVEAVENKGVRAWIWSDYIWRHPDLFAERMPKSVLQSNWYYGDAFNEDISYVKAYHELNRLGYDQVPTGSNWSTPVNFEKTVDYCSKVIDRDKLQGFLQTPWKGTLPKHREHHIAAIDQIAAARKLIEG